MRVVVFFLVNLHYALLTRNNVKDEAWKGPDWGKSRQGCWVQRKNPAFDLFLSLLALFFPPCSIAIMRSVQLSLKLSSPVYTLSLTQRAQHYTNMANRCFKHLAHQSIHKNKNETNKQKKKRQNGSSRQFHRAPFWVNQNQNHNSSNEFGSIGSYLGFLHPHCTLVRSIE